MPRRQLRPVPPVPRPSGPARLVWLAAALGLGAGACGPSFQVIYEGNARFERCYALEEDARVPMSEKASCWRAWSERYTYGQTRDRIHYATARYVALSRAPTMPTDEALMMAAPGEVPRATTITAPAPTSAFAPPPKVLDPDATARPVEGLALAAAPHAGTLPLAGCAAGCGSGYHACGDRCVSGPKEGACEACLDAYRACMRGCFE